MRLFSRLLVVGVDCPDATRGFVITRKLSCCPDRAPRIEKGRVTFGADEDRREVDGASDVRLKHSSGSVELLDGALGSQEDWARLQVTCPSTGAVVFDSGEVRRGRRLLQAGQAVHVFLRWQLEVSR